MGRPARVSDHRRREQPMECLMPQCNDLSRSLVPFQQDGTLVAVVELSRSSWLVAGLVPGLEHHPLKKLDPSEEALLALLRRWRDEAAGAGRAVTRVAVACEAGRDDFWLARWLQARGLEAHVIHPTSVAVSREHRRAKTDRLDTGLLKRASPGWLRGEPGSGSAPCRPARAASPRGGGGCSPTRPPPRRPACTRTPSARAGRPAGAAGGAIGSRCAR